MHRVMEAMDDFAAALSRHVLRLFAKGFASSPVKPDDLQVGGEQSDEMGDHVEDLLPLGGSLRVLPKSSPRPL
jgi:hypothetical protein